MAIVINGSGTVTGISVGGLPDGIVDSGTLATNSVDSAELIDGSIDLAHLAADSVDGTKIADDAIDSEHYAAGSIDTAHIGTDQITSAILPAGSVLQVVAFQSNSNMSTTSTTFVDSPLYVAITPASTDNKILVMITCGIDPGTAGMGGTIERTVGATETNLGGATEGFVLWGASSGRSVGNLTYLDSPSTTSEVTYKFQIRSVSGGTVECPPWSTAEYSIIAIEVAG